MYVRVYTIHDTRYTIHDIDEFRVYTVTSLVWVSTLLVCTVALRYISSIRLDVIEASRGPVCYFLLLKNTSPTGSIAPPPPAGYHFAQKSILISKSKFMAKQYLLHHYYCNKLKVNEPCITVLKHLQNIFYF